MEEKMGLIDVMDSLGRIGAKLEFLQTVLGGALYDNSLGDLVLNPDEQAGIFWFFQDLGRDISQIREALDAVEEKREPLLDAPKFRAAQGEGG